MATEKEITEAITHLDNLIEKFDPSSTGLNMQLVRKVEAIGRKMRRRSDVTTEQVRRSKGRYGAVCKANRDKYRTDVNFLYWNTSNSVRQIARHLGITEPTVNNLIEAKPADAVEPTPITKRVRPPI